MNKLKIIVILILLFVSIHLAANKMKYLIGINAAAYYPEYTKYKFDEPVFGVQVQCDLFNLIDFMGIGGSTFQKVYTLDDRFSLMRSYNIYLHNYANYSTKDSYFTYGFYGGIKRTELDYIYDKISAERSIIINKPLFGFHFASEKWGLNISWTQAENKKPILGYELKFRNTKNIIMRIGRINRGAVSNINSEIYILFGYEFFK
ncbi:MAG: hypothetical protein P9L97_12860 [Candidatus Tenebribacter davisii]|jgi:hypothetical protein|nr:hypothetical protein [Candidatus Tenebribacter davisii]